jgi:hypothetical protein
MPVVSSSPPPCIELATRLRDRDPARRRLVAALTIDHAVKRAMDKHEKSGFTRAVKVTAGFALLPVGVALLVLPGPGIPVVVGSLMLLESEFDWARKTRVQINRWTQTGMARLKQQRARMRNAGLDPAPPMPTSAEETKVRD